MFPAAVHALIARHEGDVVVHVDNAKQPPFSVSQRQQMAPLQRMSKLRRKNKRRGIVLPNRWSTATPPLIVRDSPVQTVKNRTLHPIVQQSSSAIALSAPSSLALSPLGSLGSEQSSSPSKPIRRSSVKAESIKDYIAPIDIMNQAEATSSSELKMPLRRQFPATSATISTTKLIQATQRRASASSTQSNTTAVSTALRMPVRRSSLKSSFHRNVSCHSYFDDETTIRSSQTLSKPERNSSFKRDDADRKSETQSSSSSSSQGNFPLKRRSGFEAFRQVLTMPVRRSSLHEDADDEKPQRTQAHRTSSYESYAEEQARIRAAAFDSGIGEREEDIFARSESFASSNSSMEEIITTNESFASCSSSESFASSDSSLEEDSTETQSLDLTNNDTSESSSEAEIIAQELLGFDDNEDVSNDVDDSTDNDEEEYRKYYQDEVEKRDITEGTVGTESLCEGPDSSLTKADNALRRAWKRLSLNHSQAQADLDVKEIWSKTNSDSGLPRRGSLNHILYTQWKSSHSSDSIQRTSPLQRKASRRWSMTSTTSTLRTASTTASTVSSLSAASLLLAPLDHDIYSSSRKEVVTMGPSPTGTRKTSKGRWWKPTTTRNVSMATRPSAPQL